MDPINFFKAPLRARNKNQNKIRSKDRKFQNYTVLSRHEKLVGHHCSYGSSVPACSGQSPCSRLIAYCYSWISRSFGWIFCVIHLYYGLRPFPFSDWRFRESGTAFAVLFLWDFSQAGGKKSPDAIHNMSHMIIPALLLRWEWQSGYKD